VENTFVLWKVKAYGNKPKWSTLIFFYQQWINKIKGDTSGVSQPIYRNQNWTSNVIHTRTSPLWLEQNNLKERKPIPKKTNRLPKTEPTYIHLATRRVTHARYRASATTDYTHMENVASSIGDHVDLWRTPFHRPTIMLTFTDDHRLRTLGKRCFTDRRSCWQNAASSTGDHAFHTFDDHRLRTLGDRLFIDRRSCWPLQTTTDYAR